MGAGREHARDAATGAARVAAERLGNPDLGVVLGSGWRVLAGRLGPDRSMAFRDVPGFPLGAVPGQGEGIVSAQRDGFTVWVFTGRLHLYEGLGAGEVVFPVAMLAAAGARAVLLTCAAGGLAESDRPGDLAVVVDHLNLTGTDPADALAEQQGGCPAFVDLQGAYDPILAETWRGAARGAGRPMRDGILASVRGPSFETPAEVRMLRALGADLVSMSTVPEVIAARRLGLRVTALACVANRGAGMDDDVPLDHEDVLATVRGAVDEASEMLIRGLDAVLANVGSATAS